MKLSKRDNSNVDLKVAVRSAVAERLPYWHVLDLYCGSKGIMYRNLWHRADGYLGTDKNRPHSLATTIRISAELAAQHFPLDEFNIFDVDCYDSPWIVARRIVRRRGPGRFGLILTTGESRRMRCGSTNEIIRATLGLSAFSDLRLLDRYRDLMWGVMLRSILECVPEVTASLIIKGQAGGSAVATYFGLLLDKQPVAGV